MSEFWTREEIKRWEREEKERELQELHAEAEAITRRHEARIQELRTLLTACLDTDPYIPFDRFKEPFVDAKFDAPPALAQPVAEPQERDFLPQRPTGWRLLSPGSRRAFKGATEQGRMAYEQALASHRVKEEHREQLIEQARCAHQESVAEEHERVRLQHQAVAQWEADFQTGTRKAVADYFQAVLAAQRYPQGFPTNLRAAYVSAERRLFVEIELPLLDAVPTLRACEYQLRNKKFKDYTVPVTERKAIYLQIIAQMMLRTLRTVFLADRHEKVCVVVCNGIVDTINRATGQPARPFLSSVQVTAEQFGELNLTQVDPLDCLTYLHAKTSRTPEKLVPVQPIIDYPWDDLPYADELDAAIDLDSCQNVLDLDGYEFERLMRQLFEAIGFTEVRLTRTHSDGGIDLVAVNTAPFIGGRAAIQAKRWSPHRKVGVNAVREIAGSIQHRDFNKGIIVTTSSFTSAARDEAERLAVELYEGERLLWLIRTHLHREFDIVDAGRRRPPINPPRQ